MAAELIAVGGALLSLLATEAGQAALMKLFKKKGLTVAELTALAVRVGKLKIPPPTRPKV